MGPHAVAGGWRSHWTNVRRGLQAETTIEAPTSCRRRGVTPITRCPSQRTAVDKAPVRTSPPVLEGRPQRLGEGTAPHHRAPDMGDVAHGVGQRAEAGAGQSRG